MSSTAIMKIVLGTSGTIQFFQTAFRLPFSSLNRGLGVMFALQCGQC